MPLYQIFFELQCDLCEAFPSLSPFDIRKQTVYEVFLLVRRMNRKAKKPEKQVIRRPASDTWF